MANCSEVADRIRGLIVRCYEEAGFGVTVGDPMEGGRYIGLTPMRSPARWCPHNIKLGHLARLLDQLIASTRAVAVDLVHTTLAIYIWMGLLWRPCLSYPQRLFSFTRQHAGEHRWLDCSLRDELRYMRAALPFIYADLARQPAPWVTATDASGPGDSQYDPAFPGAYCVAVSQPPYHEIVGVMAAIETVGRTFHMAGPLGGEARQLASLPGTQLLARTVIPASWCSPAVPWRSVIARRWRSAVEISRGELRAEVLGVRVGAATGGGARRELLLLGDNQGAVAQVVRGRSSHPDQNQQLRHLASTEAIGDMRARAAWVMTTRMPADWGTRPDAEGRLRLGSISWAPRTKVLVVHDAGDGVAAACRSAALGPVQVWEWPVGAGATGRRPGWVRKFLREIESGLVVMVWWHVASAADCTEHAPVAAGGGLSEVDVALWAGRLARDSGTVWALTLPTHAGPAAVETICRRARGDGFACAAFPVTLKNTVDIAASVSLLLEHATINDCIDTITATHYIDHSIPIVTPNPHSRHTVTTTCITQPLWLDSRSVTRHRRGTGAAAVGAAAWRRARWSPAPWHVLARLLSVALARSRGRVDVA